MKRINRFVRVAFFMYIIMLNATCSKSPATTTQPNPPDVSNLNFANGADISWLTQMEASGYKFYSDDGIEEDCM